VLEVTACADESDELASLEVYNTVWPRDGATIEAVHSYRDSAQDYIDYLVREDRLNVPATTDELRPIWAHIRRSRLSAQVQLTADQQQVTTTDNPIMGVSGSAALRLRLRPDRRIFRLPGLCGQHRP
jgi:hypothetical protein